MKHNYYDKYWQLEDYSRLSKRTLVVEAVIAGYANADKNWTRGQLEQCSNEELRQFALDRRISLDIADELISQPTLTIHRLLEEDSKPRFTKFLYLPPELRNRIYVLYDSRFKRYLINPTKPPLAQTCRQLKQEVLPVFFSSHGFELKVVRAQKDAPIPRGKTPIFHEDRDAEYFLSTLTEADAANIRSLNLVVNDKYKAGSSTDGYGTVGAISVSIPMVGCPLQQQYPIDSMRGDFLIPWNLLLRWKLRAQIRKQMETIQERDVGARFKLQDLHELRKAVSAAYR